MRRLLSGRVTPAMLGGLAVVLAAGGGYAVARHNGSGTITACVHRKGHGMYTGRCAMHDRKLTWNKTGPTGATGPPGQRGPQGPGATKLVYDARGTSPGTTTPIGLMGPYFVSAKCSQPSAGTTTLDVFFSGPGGRLDGVGDGGIAASGVFAAATNKNLFGTISSSNSTGNTLADDVMWIPTSGSSIQTLLTGQAVGGATNSCHFSVAITPVS